MIVVDASVALVSLLGEEGHGTADLLLETQACGMSLVNLSEVHARLLSHGMTNRTARSLIDALELRELPFDRTTCELAASLRIDTAAVGLGIADRACLATGLQLDALVVTADRDWSRLTLPLEIQVVR